MNGVNLHGRIKYLEGMDYRAAIKNMNNSKPLEYYVWKGSGLILKTRDLSDWIEYIKSLYVSHRYCGGNQ